LLALFALVIVLVGSAALSRVNVSYPRFAGAILLFVALWCVGLAILLFFVGRGMWLGQNWARVLALVFAWIGVVADVFALAGERSVGVDIIGIVVNGFIIWYLTRPGVKKWFVRPPYPQPVM
jgi:hypothetical protein